MVQFANLDTKVALTEQLGEADAPVVLVNVFTVDEADTDAMLKTWTSDARFMRRQPGFISTQLHRGIGSSTTFMNYAVWDSAADFARAFEQPQFQSQIRNYPASVVSRPHLFAKMAVPGICVAG